MQAYPTLERIFIGNKGVDHRKQKQPKIKSAEGEDKTEEQKTACAQIIAAKRKHDDPSSE